jgi:hypothetical protein
MCALLGVQQRVCSRWCMTACDSDAGNSSMCCAQRLCSGLYSHRALLLQCAVCVIIKYTCSRVSESTPDTACALAFGRGLSRPFQDNNQVRLYLKIKKGTFSFHTKYWDSISADAKVRAYNAIKFASARPQFQKLGVLCGLLSMS